MKNIFSKTIANLRESGNLKVTRQTFSNQIVFDQSIQCGQFTSNEKYGFIYIYL